MRSVPLSVRYSAVNLITQRSASSLLSSTASTSTSSYIYSHSSSSSSRHSNVSGLFQRYSFPLLRAGHRPFHTTQYNLNGKNQQGTTSSVHAEGEQVEGDIKVHGNQSGSEEEKTVTVRIDSRGLRHPRPDGVEEERFMRWPRAENTDAAESEKEGDQDHSSSSSSSFSSSSSLTADDATLEDYLDGIISISGALPIATFMKEALTHPRLGYYMKPRQGSGGDMFGRAGDFTTSPEISQMFGEVLGTLCVDNWIKLGRPKSFNLVEMGPGRGSLMCDILRTGSHFEGFLDAVSVHFIERSTYLQQVQAERLKCVGWQYQDDGEGDNIAQQESLRIADLVAIEERQMLFPEAGRQGLTKSKKYGCNVSWHVNWDELPAGPTLFLGHEFLDALPIHKFECTDQGWRELLVDRAPRTQESVSVEVRRRHEEGKDNDQEEDAESLRGQDNPRFRYVLSPGPTISTQIFRDYLPVAVPVREICAHNIVEGVDLFVAAPFRIVMSLCLSFCKFISARIDISDHIYRDIDIYIYIYIIGTICHSY